MRKIINLETLELYDSVSSLSSKLKVSPQRVYMAVMMGQRIKRQLFEYYDFWKELPDLEKESHTFRNNIFFLNGKQTNRQEDKVLRFKSKREIRNGKRVLLNK